MRKLILKILVLLVGVVIINQFLFLFIKLPFSWGSYYEKEYCLEKNAVQYNTILLGSSRIHRQIDPFLFDSLNCAVGDTTTTFNFGNDAMTIPEIYYQFENVLKIPNLKPKYIIVELCDVDTFANVNLHTVRKKYYYSVAAWWHSINTLICSEYSMSRKLSGCLSHCINFFETLLRFNSLSETVKFNAKEGNIAYACNPFYSPLNSNDTTQVFYSGKMWSNPHLKFMRHPEQLDQLKSESAKLFAEARMDNGNTGRLNEPYLRLANQIINDGKGRSIKVIFFLPPKLERIHYQNVLPIFNAIPIENKIELADPTKHGEFYKLSYAFDLGHVNKEGATVLTKKFAQQFQKLHTRKAQHL